MRHVVTYNDVVSCQQLRQLQLTGTQGRQPLQTQNRGMCMTCSIILEQPTGKRQPDRPGGMYTPVSPFHALPSSAS